MDGHLSLWEQNYWTKQREKYKQELLQSTDINFVVVLLNIIADYAIPYPQLFVVSFCDKIHTIYSPKDGGYQIISFKYPISTSGSSCNLRFTNAYTSDMIFDTGITNGKRHWLLRTDGRIYENYELIQTAFGVLQSMQNDWQWQLDISLYFDGQKLTFTYQDQHHTLHIDCISDWHFFVRLRTEHTYVSIL